MKSDGFSLDDKRTALPESDIPDIIERFHNLQGEKARERTDQSFFVPKQEIVANDYDLSINKYKKTVYKPVEYPPTSEIIKQIEEIEADIQRELAELKKLLTP
jgi:type I restriction enzyme M protein